MRRSSKYDDVFQRKTSEKGGFKVKTPKERFKIIWKFAKIFLYLSLAALSLTGCVQTFVLKSSSTVGSGIEFYNSKNSIASYVNSYKVVSKTVNKNKIDENGNIIQESVKVDTLLPLTKENFLVSDETIKNIKNSLSSEYDKQIASKYGTYNNQSSSLRIIGDNDLNLSKSNYGISGSETNDSELMLGTKTQKPLFLNNQILSALNENGKNYQIQNIWTDINFFALKKPEKEENLTDAQKTLFSKGITNINSSFQPFELGSITRKWTPVQFLNGQYVTYDSNRDGINDSKELIVIKDEGRISKFKYAFDAEIVNINKSDASLLNSELYARDYLQSIANVIIQFQQLDDFLRIFSAESTVLPSDSETRFNLISKDNIANKILNHQELISHIDEKDEKSKKLLNLNEKNSFLAYQSEILNIINGLGFGIKKQIYSSNDSIENTSQWNDSYQVEYLPGISDKKNRLLGASPIEQKPITSWSEAWGLGPFYGLAVWPIAYIVNALVGSMPSLSGWSTILAIIITVIVTRILTTLITYKSVFAQHKQQALAPKKAKIDAKYEGFKGNKQMETRKRQEIADLYKKNNVSMAGSLLSTLVTMPVFLAVWRVIQGITDIKSTTWLGIQFSQTSWRELFNGAWQYLPLLILAVVVQAISQLLPRYLNKKRISERSNVTEKAVMKKANKTQNIIMFVFIFLAVAFEAGVQIYWIVGGIWQILQTLIVNLIVKTNFYKEKLYKYV